MATIPARLRPGLPAQWPSHSPPLYLTPTLPQCPGRPRPPPPGSPQKRDCNPAPPVLPVLGEPPSWWGGAARRGQRSECRTVLTGSASQPTGSASLSCGPDRPASSLCPVTLSRAEPSTASLRSSLKARPRPLSELTAHQRFSLRRPCPTTEKCRGWGKVSSILLACRPVPGPQSLPKDTCPARLKRHSVSHPQGPALCLGRGVTA